MKKQKQLSPSDYWATPNEPGSVFEILDREFNFEWDACATADNTKVPGCYFDEAQDSLRQDWHKTAHMMWLNPPYSDVTPWLEKAKLEASKGCTVVCLLKADHTTKWWKNNVFDYKTMKPYPGVEIRDWPVRIKFLTPKGMVDAQGRPVKSVTPPWPNVVVIFRAPK